jgi:hypothetical protein
VVGLGKSEVCPFTKEPCTMLESCDDAMILRLERRGLKGFDTENGVHCPRAVAALK